VEVCGLSDEFARFASPGGMSPFHFSVVPSPLMLGYALVYLLLVFSWALTIFQRRDP